MEGFITWHVQSADEHPVAEIVVGDVHYAIHPEIPVHIDVDHRGAVIDALETRPDTASVDR